MFEEAPYGAYNFNVLRGILEGFAIIQNGMGVEVGVFEGGTSMYLLQSFPQLTLVSVDPYKAYHEYDQEKLNQAEAAALDRLKPYGERSRRLKLDSITAAKSFPDNCFDFVFIDASHTYDAVSADLEAWYRTVRPGGLFSGHDYRWGGVTKAVDEFAEARSIKGRCSPKESDIWYFNKR